MKSAWYEKVFSFGFFRLICCTFTHFVFVGCRGGSEQEKPICGDGVAEEDEICDGEDLSGETCESLGLFDGTLLCRADCSGYDASQCINEPECGNNIVEEWEACDGSDLNGKTCENLGLVGGTLLCRADCSGYVVSSCIGEPECGNNIAEAGEECDGHDLRGETCGSLHFVGGELHCNENCTLDTSLCWEWQGISSGRNHTCGVKSVGTAWCWGANFTGQLGDWTTTHSSTPVEVVTE